MEKTKVCFYKLVNILSKQVMKSVTGGSAICFILLSLCFLSGCSRGISEKTDEIAVIDVINNLGNYQETFLSEFVSEIEYIPLETKDDCLMGGVRDIILTPSHIFVHGYTGGSGGDFIVPGITRCYAFRRDGSFVCEIGRIGQGPGEYQNISGLSIDEKNQLLYIETYRTLLEYAWSGEFRRSINKPQNSQEIPVGQVVHFQDNLFVGHCPNHRGQETHTFLLFNDSGRVIKTFENHVKFDRQGDGSSFEAASMRPIKVADSYYVKEIPNDTLYCLNKQNELIPQFVFDLGKYTFSKEKRGRKIDAQYVNTMSEVLIVPSGLLPMVGTPAYIFFSLFSFSTDIPGLKGQNEGTQSILLGIYDIALKKTRFLANNPETRKVGLMNDMDNSLSFWPKYYSSENELVDVWQAYEMKDNLAEQHTIGYTIKHPQAQQKHKEIVNNLKDDDNPVVVIAKLKK